VNIARRRPAAAAQRAAPRLPHAAPAPLYTQIKDALRERILDGRYAPHDRMPSEAELTASFGVSRITVRQALSHLQNEGLIFRIHGKGTYVSQPPKAYQDLAQLQGFGEAMSRIGYEALNRVIDIRFLPAPTAAWCSSNTRCFPGCRCARTSSSA
jgi:GntR family transcriptional regulator